MKRIELTNWIPTVNIDGIEHELPNLVNNSRIGNFIMGIGMIGSWVIYIDTDDIRLGDYPSYYRYEYVRAYNTAINSVTGEHEYRFLGSYQVPRTNPSNLNNAIVGNAMKIAFSQNGLHWCMGRDSRGSGNQGTRMAMYEGHVSVDISGDTVSASAARRAGGFYNTNVAMYYGYVDNKIEYIYGTSGSSGSNSKGIYVYDWEVTNGFFFAEGWSSNDYLCIVMVHGTVFEYSSSGGGDEVNFSSPSKIFPSLGSFLNTIDSKWNVPADRASCSVYGLGAFIIWPKHMNEIYSGDIKTSNDRVSIWIDLNGKGTDMGDLLFDGAYTGGRLQCGPMIQVTSIEEGE